MAERQGDGSIAPRRSLGGPILPPPPPEMAEKARQAEEKKAAAERAAAERRAEKEARAAEKDAKRRDAARQRELARQQAAQKSAQQAAQRAAEKEAEATRQEQARAAKVREEQERQISERAAREEAQRRREEDTRPRSGATVAAVRPPAPSPSSGSGKRPRRTRRAQLRLVQIDAWSVMKTAFLLSIALGIVLVVAVGIIWSVLGAAGVWDSINSIVQQAVGTDGGSRFDVQQYVGTSRVLGFTMIVAVLDVILITAIATLGAFLYNLSAALLGGIEVTLAEDS